MSFPFSNELDLDRDLIQRVTETTEVNLKVNIQIRFKSIQYVEQL